MNVLFLTADSLRADRTSLFGHSRETTPFLARLADGGFEFRRAYANGRNTAASFPSIHTSVYQRFYDGVGIPPGGTPTMAEVLRQADFHTIAIHTNELISREYNYDRGFDVYHDSRQRDGVVNWRPLVRSLIGDGLLFDLMKRLNFLSTEHLGIKLFDTADAISGFEDEILDWVTSDDGDWFVWAHYMNPHHPYEPPITCQEALGLDPVPRREATKLSRKMRLNPEKVSAEERETLGGLYDAAVLSWDREIGSLCSSLERVGSLEDTLIIVTADHGELLGETGIYGHPPVLNQALLRVPLVFSGGPIGVGTSNEQVGLIDIGPTILSLVGCDVPEDYLGRPLFDERGRPTVEQPRTIITETGGHKRDLIGAIEDDRKLIHDVDAESWAAFELFDEATDERSTEENFPHLRDAITEHIERSDRDRQAAADVDAESLQADLAALGYLDE